MSVDRFTLNQCRNIFQLELPERSRLYRLPPWGIGTADVESLTSYIARLATIHQVPTGVLLRLFVTPILSQLTDDLKRVSHSFWSSFGSDTGAWNGLGVMAFNCSQGLSSLTKQDHLHFLTLLTWNQVLSHRGLVRGHKAWCPACYQEWDRLGVVLHEPLLWSLKLVTVCLRHQQRLQYQCPDCYRPLPSLEWNSRPGYCSKCLTWLGKIPDSLLEASLALDKQEQAWQTFVHQNLAQLLAAAPSLPSPVPRENIARGVNLCINAVTGGNAKAFADLLCYSASVPGEWRRGNALPQLDLLFRLCYCLQIPLLEFLTGKVVLDQPVSLIPLPPHQSTRKKYRPFDSALVQSLLEAALQKDPPKTMRQVALDIGYDPGDLFKYFPDLCRAISQRYKCRQLKA
ncbi:TniQ family protein [Phormidium sp. LEGE 05292]|uniref:TniQ family protein n=1 Tax=[Phormidium] sp. LEGE 05292 TaxID=767427 RepID=UPI001881C46E|nr:TniQ family protein [Phormidium sp. LEGE 05292]MBE9229916.1 TniQ family protein [Phormidium sp. LEGE 05292]